MQLIISILILVGISLFATYISKIVENKYPFYKKYCGNELLCPTTNILFVRFLHYISTFYFVLYYLVFDSKYDFYYLLLYVSLIMHWIITNDCLLSNWEMFYYNENQELGTDTLLHPHIRVFIGDYTDMLILSQGLMMIITFLLVLFRYKNQSIDTKLLMFSKFIIGITVIGTQSYSMLKDRIVLYWSNV